MLLEWLGFAVILLMFFGFPAAIFVYAGVVAARDGLLPGNTQELEKGRAPGDDELAIVDIHSERRAA